MVSLKSFVGHNSWDGAKAKIETSSIIGEQGLSEFNIRKNLCHNRSEITECSFILALFARTCKAIFCC